MATSTSARPEAIYPGMARNDVTGAVVAALAQKGNSPFIGIACGTKTVLIRRAIFKQSLRGLRIVDAELVTSLIGVIQGQYRELETRKIEKRTEPSGDYGAPGHTYFETEYTGGLCQPVSYSATHAIRVYAAAKGVKATRLFLHQDPREYSNQRILLDWKKAELKKRLPSGQKMDKYQKQIAACERKLAKLGTLRRPDNPAITPELEPIPAEMRRVEHLWYLQKPVRRAVMALARRGKADLTAAKLYTEIVKLTAPYYDCPNALEVFNWAGDFKDKPEFHYVLADKAVTVTKWGEVTAHERDRKGLTDIWAYLARLWEFCGLQSKPLYNRWKHTANWGPERYNEWQSARDARREIELMIAALNEERSK